MKNVKSLLELNRLINREKLIGKLTVVVANLAPRKMRFGVSEKYDDRGKRRKAKKDLWIVSPESGADAWNEGTNGQNPRPKKLTPSSHKRNADYADIKGCMPYATALAKNEAEINLCPPGGVQGLLDLAHLLNKNADPFIDEMKQKTKPQRVAFIREAECIGCTKCIQACPVDAILGTSKQMHTVIAAECTGCELCISPCPVDCIDMVVVPETNRMKEQYRERYVARSYD